MNGDHIVIDDDTCDVIDIIDTEVDARTVRAKEITDTIVIEDTITKSRAINRKVIIIDDSEEMENKSPYNEIYEENKLLVEFVEKCINLENSQGMSRIVNKTLLSIYKEADPGFKKSSKFDRLLLKSIKKLECDPDHKFSHIKAFCETLKLHKFKKRVEFVTLATNLNGNGSNTNEGNITKHTNLKRHSTSHILNKKPKVDIIDLDNEQESVINLDDEPTNNDVILIDNQSVDQIENYNKENNALPINNNIPLENRLETDKPNLNYDELGDTNIIKDILRNGTNNAIAEANSTSIPCHAHDSLLKPIEIEVPALDTEKEIEDIEKEIARYKKMIAHLEEQEVRYDTNYSPYVRSEKYKSEIVKLYTKLCALTGAEPVKRREVRFQVTPGHPPGPVRCLEQYLNRNMQENGEPPFPDFADVVTCVATANRTDELGWSAPRIMSEANALFTQCGRALQKRRQQREWRDLMSRVKEEIHDPADEDPELFARLEQNKQIARRNEEEIINRFKDMENERNHCSPNLELHINDTHDSDDEYNGNEVAPTEVNFESETICSTKSNISVDEVTSTGNVTDNTNVETVLSSDKETVTDVKIKTEPLDIAAMLDGLGDNFTATIIDIEDPFVVIEISSDSDSDDSATGKSDKADCESV